MRIKPLWLGSKTDFLLAITIICTRSNCEGSSMTWMGISFVYFFTWAMYCQLLSFSTYCFLTLRRNNESLETGNYISLFWGGASRFVLYFSRQYDQCEFHHCPQLVSSCYHHSRSRHMRPHQSCIFVFDPIIHNLTCDNESMMIDGQTKKRRFLRWGTWFVDVFIKKYRAACTYQVEKLDKEHSPSTLHPYRGSSRLCTLR